MPRIQTQTLAQHRDWRRNQLIDAAASIAMESGGAAVTVAAVAQRAGLSRTSVYEYFASGSELVADLVIDELKNFGDTLNVAVSECSDSTCVVTCWIKGALEYIAMVDTYWQRHLTQLQCHSLDPKILVWLTEL